MAAGSRDTCCRRFSFSCSPLNTTASIFPRSQYHYTVLYTIAWSRTRYHIEARKCHAPVYINILSALYVIVDESTRYAAYCWSSGRWATRFVADSPRRLMRKLVTFGTVATTITFWDARLLMLTFYVVEHRILEQMVEQAVEIVPQVNQVV
jgi:hypothetical protein